MSMQNGTTLRGTWDPNSGLQAQQGDDNRAIVEFRMHPVVDAQASKDAARTIKRDVPYVKILHPGEANLSVYDQPATDQDVMRFPRQWAAFKANQSQQIIGTPLDLLFPDSPAIVANLKSASVFTVDQLAVLNDTALQAIGMGARLWQEKAKAYLEQADKGKDFHGLSNKVDQLVLERQADKDRIAALEAALAEASASAANKRGKNAA